MHETTGYIAGPHGPLYASWHAPAGDEPTRVVLVAGPFGEERKCAYRLLVNVAKELAVAGCGVLRLDLSGTGESDGDHAAASVSRWRADLAAGAATARALGGEAPLALLGVRLGANLLAGLSTEQAAGADALLAVAPLLRGEELLEDLLRRKQIKEMMGGGAASSDADAIRAQWAAGETVDVDGFAIGPALATELADLDLLADLRASSGDRQSLLLHCTGARSLRGPWAEAEAAMATLNGRVDLLPQRPFWGRTDVHDPALLVVAAAELLNLTVCERL